MKKCLIELYNPKKNLTTESFIVDGFENAQKEVKVLNKELNKKPNKKGQFWKIGVIM